MIIAKPSVVLTRFQSGCDQLIAEAGAVAHQTESIRDIKAFIRKLIKWGHESVLEHTSATFFIVCDRGISHEIVRHRIASYTQESTRYCRYEDQITVIKPPDLHYDNSNNWSLSIEYAEEIYFLLLDHGIAPEIARSVLPTCLKTQIVMTANFREWRHFLKLRLSSKAHPQMREIARMIRDKLCDISVCFEEFKEKDNG